MIGPYTFRSSAKVPIHDETKNKVPPDRGAIVLKRDPDPSIDALEYVTTVHTAPSLQRDLPANWVTKVLLRGRSPPANAGATTAIVLVAHESNLRAFH